MTDSKEREAFEKWVTRNDTYDHTFPLALNKNGDYEDGELKPQWEAWQARGKAVVVPEGWWLVPVEATDEMTAAARQAALPAVMLDSISARERLMFFAQYKAAISAAPNPPSLGDGEDIEALRKDAQRFSWIRTEAARLKGKDDAGALRVSVTYRERRSDGDGFIGLLITPRDHDFDAAIDAAMAAGEKNNA